MNVLLVACSAVLTGARSFAAIGRRVRSAPQGTLARLGIRITSVFNVPVAPSAINQLRTVGHTNIAAGIREMSYQPFHRPPAYSDRPDQQRSEIVSLATALMSIPRALPS
ncbi:hypothetical protein ACFYN6_40300, partial [Streptomyces sp. NPDC007172]